MANISPAHSRQIIQCVYIGLMDHTSIVKKEELGIELPDFYHEFVLNYPKELHED